MAESQKQIGEPEHEMSFLDHLAHLRGHLVRSVLAIILFASVAFVYREYIFTHIILASRSSEFVTFVYMCDLSHLFGMGDILCFNDQNLKLQSVQMAGQFTASLWSAIVIGFIIAFPYILWELWRFIKPGLKNKERKYTRGVVFYSTTLFLLGVLFGYYVIVPLSVNFLGTFQVSSSVENIITLSSFVSTVTTLVLSCGLVFELPILVYFLTKVGLIDDAFLKKYRRHAIVLTLILSAIITPPDFLSQILVSIPILLLYEVGIKVAKFVKAKEK